MPTPLRARLPFLPSLPLALFLVLLGTMFLAGGSSRPEIFGQVVVRAVAALVLVAAILIGPKPDWGAVKPVAVLLALIVALPLLQLIPLPPELWQALPGRAPLSKAAELIGEPQPWRPLSMVPGATINAAASLLVPVATLILLAQMSADERRSLTGPVLAMIGASALVGLLQFSGADMSNPLNDAVAGQVSGFFGNRNHFALLLALGCVIAPVWALADDAATRWRAPVAAASILIFALVLLASGSRAGLALGVLGIATALLFARRALRRALRRYPRWVVPAAAGGLIAVVAGLVLLSMAAGRAISIERLLTVDPGQDLRALGLPTILAMTRLYFPVGTGFGSFDPVFRIHEPAALLAPGYFNHAHNDVLEIVLDGGVAGGLVLAAAIIWAVRRSWNAWRGAEAPLPLLGGVILLLVLLASVVDYPARTPLVMMLVVLAAAWLADAPGARRRAALPAAKQ